MLLKNVKRSIKSLTIILIKISKNHFGKIDVITFTNVFAHINNFSELIGSLKLFISNNPNILIVIENHYLGSVLNKKQFDTFYQEHPRTYSVTSFNFISNLLGLNISKLNFPKRYGGNIRVFLSKQNKINVNRLILREVVLLINLIKCQNL